MNMVNPDIVTGQVPGILFRESERLPFTELNSPALIILKTDTVRTDELERLGGFLSEKEIAKSRRFRFSRDRVSYIVVHGLLRWLLGGYLGIPPETIDITYNASGKPSVSGYSRQMFFNLSHSSGLSVLAFDPENEIGADVERIDHDFDYETIVQHFFSPEEGRYIFDLKEESRQRFYEIWTRKEALLKAVGIGITENLHLEVLKERINVVALNGDMAGNGDFLFSSVMFEQNFRITLAMNECSSGINAFVIGNNNRQPITEA